MSRHVRTLVGIVLPVLAILVFAVLLAFSLMRLSEIERDMRIEASQNMLWVISRAHVSSLQLAQGLSQASHAEPDLLELTRRYNVFLSQLAVLSEGPQQRQMERLGLADAFGVFKLTLPELAASVSQLQAGRSPDLTTIDALLQPYHHLLSRAANMAMVAEWDELGGKLDTSRKQIWHIIVSLAAISLAGAFVSVYFLLAVRDARRRARLLEQEKAFSELLIESSGEGILAVDRQLRCTIWNEAMQRLFHIPTMQANGLVLSDISGFFQIASIRKALDDALAGRATVLLDQPYFLPDQDQPLYVDLRCFSLRDSTRIIGSIVLVSDVTERRLAQREIADHRDRLEQLVQARTGELDAALQRERETTDLYRNFGAMVSHQFRTPLAIVDSALQRLIRRSDMLEPGELVQRSDKARQAIARLVRLVDSTLNAARLDAGQIEVQSEPVDLVRLVAELALRQQETTERTILVEGESSAVIAQGDPVHIEHVLTNLLSNAIKYSPAHSQVVVNLSVHEGAVHCAISNLGQIDCPIERDNVFERYFRGRNAEGRPGIGIGLYMARTLARLQGGDIILVVTEADQTMFTLTLPMASSHPQAPASARMGELA